MSEEGTLTVIVPWVCLTFTIHPRKNFNERFLSKLSNQQDAVSSSCYAAAVWVLIVEEINGAQ